MKEGRGMLAIRQLFAYLSPYKVFAIVGPLLMVVEVMMDLIQPTIMQHMIDTGIANGDHPYVIKMFIFMLISAVIGLIGGVGCTIYSSKAAIHFATDIRQDLYETLAYFSSTNRDRIGTGKLITILTSDVEAVQRALMMTLKVFVRGPLLFVGAVIIVFVTARELFSILLIVVPILIICMILFTKFSGALYKRVQEAMDQVNTSLQENLAGIRVIKAFRSEKYHIDQFAEINETLTKRNISANQVIGILMPVTMFIINLGIIAALWMGAIKVDNGTLQVGVILAFVNYLTIIMNGLMSSSMVLMQIARAFPSSERIIDVLNTKQDVQSGTAMADIHGDVEFDHVTYSYNDNGEHVLKDISFHAKAGSVIGIIGKTGSGKSTLVKLLPRLFDVQSGRVLIDGKPIQQYDLGKLRGSIGVTPQKAMLFSGTIDDNVRFGKDDATNQHITTALTDAVATEFIDKLELGTAHELTQGATNLSGGQKQRLSMARAFVRKPAILVLDDTTSALDSISEKAVQRAIEANYQDSTIFIVASKIASIQMANQILVLDDGKLVGKGTHAELLKTCATYQEIYQTQVKGA